MIKTITVTNYLGDSLTLDLFRPEESGFVVESVTGLGPVKATINATELSTTDGSLYNSARVPSRNIVLSLKFLWKNTIEDVRQLSYKYFPIKKGVTLRIETDNRVGEIDGYVESNEPDIFSAEEGTDISIICPYPFFRDAYETQSTTFGGVVPMFEFPFWNDSTTEPLMIMSELRTRPDRTIIYEGDYEIGVTIHIRASGNASNVTIFNVNTRETMYINTNVLENFTGQRIVAGDEIVISTVKSKKYCRLIRNGQTINILNCIDRNSSWFQITKGENIFAYTAEYGADRLQIEIQNDIIYEGM